MTKELISYKKAEENFFDLFPEIILMGVLQEPENIRLLLFAKASLGASKDNEQLRTQEEWDKLFRFAVLGTVSQLFLIRMSLSSSVWRGSVSDEDRALAEIHGGTSMSDFENWLLGRREENKHLLGDNVLGTSFTRDDIEIDLHQ